MASVVPKTIQVSAGTLSALAIVPQRPVGLILALHGGGFRAGYWHAPSIPESSLLQLGADLNYAVVAVDRPGYGASTGWPRARQDLNHQADVMFDVIAELQKEAPLANVPVFVIGHSMGGILTLIMAAHRRAATLTAVDVAGVPLRFPAEMQDLVDAQKVANLDLEYTPEPSESRLRDICYGPDDTLFPTTLAHDATIRSPVPIAEGLDAFNAPARLPEAMKRIKFPVQLTIAELEKSSVGGEPMLEYAESLLSQARRKVTWLQLAAGHNISLHKVARAYHLRALAFFEECRWLNG